MKLYVFPVAPNPTRLRLDRRGYDHTEGALQEASEARRGSRCQNSTYRRYRKGAFFSLTPTHSVVNPYRERTGPYRVTSTSPTELAPRTHSHRIPHTDKEMDSRSNRELD